MCISIRLQSTKLASSTLVVDKAAVSAGFKAPVQVAGL